MEPLSVAIGGIVAKWAFRLWLKDSEFSDLALDLTDLIKGKIPEFYESRRASRQFEQISEIVALRIEPLVERELRGLDQGERTSATLAAEKTLNIGLTQSVNPITTDFDSSQLERQVRQADPTAVRSAGLSEAGEALYDLIISESCNYITQIATELPGFSAAATQELLSRDSQIIEIITNIFDRLPAPRVPLSWGPGSEDERFTARYLTAVERRANELQIFGAELPSHRRRYSLSVAYISLSATFPGSDSNQSRQSMASDAKDNSNSEPAKHERSPEDQVVRVEAALGGQNRIIVGGSAGSGKTTLLQWLALTACQNAFTGDLAPWNGSIPFLLPLRRYVGIALPAPQDFLHFSYGNLEAVIPDGFVHRILDSGKALILLDGLDELPENERANARSWLNELMSDFPDCTYVVTSRSLAVSNDWKSLSDFRFTELMPMQRQDIRAFISHWHTAAAHNVESIAEQEQIRLAEIQMLAAVDNQPAIRSLCTTPLLCALICALHRDRVNKLPQNKMDLYDAALRMLIINRDLERDISVDQAAGLSYTEKRALLEDFALWLHENGASDAPEDLYLKRIVSKAQAMPHTFGTGHEIAQGLIARSGVLRRPVEGRVDFIHRTFLEYLAAAALIEDEAIDKILLHAHDDQWREVVIMSAGHANRKQRERLIHGLIDRGKEVASLRHRLFLLAVGCMQTSSVLEPQTQRLLIDCLSEILPPTNMTEASAVASAGPLAIPQLAAYKGNAKEVSACVRALGLIGTEEALVALKNFSTDDRVTVARQLIRAWVQFDPEPYARDVLAESPLDRGHLFLNDPDHLHFVHYLKNVEGIFVDAPGRVQSLSIYPENEHVFGFDASYCKSITSLRDFAHFPKMSTFWLRSCPSLESLDGAEVFPELQNLYLMGSSALQDLSALGKRHDSIADLQIQSTAVASLDSIAKLPIFDLSIGHSSLLTSLGKSLNAKRLSISGAFSLTDYGALKRSPSITSLVLGMVNPEVKKIELPPDLRDLRISVHGRQSDPLQISGGKELRSLDVTGDSAAEFVEGLPELPKLVELRLWVYRVDPLVRLSLPPTPKLKMLYMSGNGISSGDAPEVPGFEVLNSMSRAGRVIYSRI